MTYDEAMAAINRNGTAEVGRAGMRIRWRFGRPVVLRAEGGHIDYTPTYEDMHAEDWEHIGEPLPTSWTIARVKRARSGGRTDVEAARELLKRATQRNRDALRRLGE